MSERDDVLKELDEQVSEDALDTSLGAAQREWNKQNVMRILLGEDESDEPDVA